ncbi:MAG: hypothetical protein R2856_25275 [Caldilineaceae bacterium]
MVKSGFHKIILLNGHGGSTDSNRVVALDMANRLGHPVRIAAAAYWDVARAAWWKRPASTANSSPAM